MKKAVPSLLLHYQNFIIMGTAATPAVSEAERFCLGIDVGKDSLCACLGRQTENLKQHFEPVRHFANNAKGIVELCDWLHKRQIPVDQLTVVMEATGVYYQQLAHHLDERGYKVSVQLAKRVKDYARSLEYKSKTDPLDARILARMGLERSLREWTPPATQWYHLRQLMRLYQSLKHQQVKLKNELHAFEHTHHPNDVVKDVLEEHIEFIDSQLEMLLEQAQKLVEADEQGMKKAVAHATSIPGVGLVTALIVLGETFGFALFTSRAQVASYAGYDVRHHCSGTSVQQKSRISKKGNSRLRNAMYFPALTTIRHAPEMKALYHRIVKRTGIKMKACVAVQRKLLLLIYTLVKKGKDYDPNYHRNREKQPCPENNQASPKQMACLDSMDSAN